MKKKSVSKRIISFAIIISLIIGCTSNVYASFSDGDFTDENDIQQEVSLPDEENLFDTSELFSDSYDNEFTYQEEFSDNIDTTTNVTFLDDSQEILEIGQTYELSVNPNDDNHIWSLYSSCDQICSLSIKLIDENNCCLNAIIYSENNPDEIIYTFEGTGDYSIELSANTSYCIDIKPTFSATLELTIQPEFETVEEDNIMLQASLSQISSKVKKLLVNTNNSIRPLSEYNDPINITVDFSESSEGVVQTFFKQYGSLSSKNTIWRKTYEEVLVDLLSDDSFLKLYKDARNSDMEDFIYSILEEIANDSSEKMTSVAGKVVKIERATLQDRLKYQISNDTEKIYILSLIAENTNDENLQSACKICMKHFFTSTMDSIGEVLIDIGVSIGISKAVSIEIVKNQILNTKLQKSYLEKMIQKFSLGTVASTVMEILIIKDVLSFVTGINARVDAYLKTVALNFIYDASISAYGNSVNGGKAGNSDDISRLYIMFNFGLQAKQEAYKSMSSMYTSSTWEKIVASDPYLKTNISMIKSFTISNYKKVSLGKLTPTCPVSNLIINLNGKRSFPLSGISYLAIKCYVSKDNKIATVNSSGEITGKKIGTTYVLCVVEQYGEEYKLICKINVIKPIGTVKINKVDASKQNLATISWNKVSDAKGYILYTSSKSNGVYKKVKTVESNILKYTMKISNGKTIYIKIRAYKTINGENIYGACSSPKKFTEIGAIWYKKVLNTNKGVYKVRCQYTQTPQTQTVYRKDFPYYLVVDLNQDGIKELILHSNYDSNYDSNTILLFTYYDNKIKPLLCTGGCGARGAFYISGKSLIVRTSGSDFQYIGYFTVSKGKLVIVRQIQHLVDKTTRPYKHLYCLNGKQTSYDEWEKEYQKSIYQKYIPSSDEKQITFKKI